MMKQRAMRGLEKPKDTGEFKDRARGHHQMRDQAGVGSRPLQAIEWASEERHDRQLNALNRTRFAAEVFVLEVPLPLVRFESHNPPHR